MLTICLSLSEKIILLAGAGRVGKRKLKTILEAGPRQVRLIEQSPCHEILDLAESGRIDLFDTYSPELLDDASLVFAATNNQDFNRLLAEAAKARNIPVNVADSLELSDFTLPATVKRGPFKLTVSTGGGSPALAARVAEELRAVYGPEYGWLTSFLTELRPVVLASGLDGRSRELLFKRLINSRDLHKVIAQGGKREVLSLVSEIIKPVELPVNFKLPSFDINNRD